MVAHEEEAIALLDGLELDEQDLKAQSHASVDGKRKPQSLKGLGRLWFAASVVVICLLLTGLFTWFLSTQHDVLPTHKERRFMGLALKPQDHSSRLPRILEFNWTITAGLRSPDGVQKRVYLVNDEFPGPTIESRPGDRIIVHVHNHLEGEGVSLHWHGLRLKLQNLMDGAVGFTQCPIPSGSSYTYNFTIGDDETGTYWWHSHSDVQRADGLWGGLIVHSPEVEKVPMDEILLMVGDWFHRNQTDVLGWYTDASSMGNEPVPDSLLINGYGRFNCDMAVPARPVNCSQIAVGELRPLLRRPSGASLRLRVVNTGTVAGFTISIDNAVLTPVRVDGGFEVQSEATSAVGILYPGERVDLDVKWAEEQPGSSWFTVHLDDENFGYPNPALVPTQSFPMTAEHTGLEPSNWAGRSRNLTLDGLPALYPSKMKAATRIREIPDKADQTLALYVKTELLAHLDYEPVGFINHTSWKPQTPPLLGQSPSSWDKNQLVPFVSISPDNPKWVTIVINNLDDGAHPFHLHGHHFYLLSSYREEARGGWGSYNPYSEEESPNSLDLDFPLRKDTVIVPRRGHVVLALFADNPGIWALHCHMLVHMASGMVMGLHMADEEHRDGKPTVPDIRAAELC